MVSLSKDVTLREYADFINAVYGTPNGRHYSLWDMLIHIQRFSMRGIKGVRKGNREKVKINLLIAMSWYASLLNRLHIDMEEIVWNRFPCLCSYCGKMPCACKTEKIDKRQRIMKIDSKKPKTMGGFQRMFGEIYPPSGRSATDAAIHLAEEMGELSEVFHMYMGDRNNEVLENIHLESADFFSCIMGVLNSLGINCAEELSIIFSDNCHVCHKLPCVCDFKSINSFKS